MNPLPPTTAAIDPIFMFIFGISCLVLIGITGVMLLFVIRYHRSRAPEPTSRADGNLWLEITWTALPTVLVLAMFAYGWSGYLTLRAMPAGAVPVTATARMWSWSFAYANGVTSPKLVVPVGRPVTVTLVAKDVLHGFYLPAFRVKRDVVPGMSNQVWFTAARPGSYDLFCSQYCGTGHSAMITTVEALPEAEFTAWLTQHQEKGGDAGRELMEKSGCFGCHSVDGGKKIGPTFKGLFGSTVKVTRGGEHLTVTADEAFLRESIRLPAATVVEGYQPIMPSYAHLSEKDLAAIVSYLKGLR